MLPTFHQPVRLEWDIPGLETVLPLLRLEQNEFAAVLGQPVHIGPTGPSVSHRWRIQVDPTMETAQLQSDLQTGSLISILPSIEHFGDSLNLLHTLAHTLGTEATYQEAATQAEVVERIHRETANTYPYFELRGLDWDELSQRYQGIADLPAEEFWIQARRWVAELGDAHTAVQAAGPRYNPPYIAKMRPTGAELTSVPEHTAAYEAGVRPGWIIHTPDPESWLAMTGASPQHAAAVAARRFLQMTTPTRWFTARSPTGQDLRWQEEKKSPPPSVQAGQGPYIRISRFDSQTPDLLDNGLQHISPEADLTIDLRGNTGGSLIAADSCRRRFLPGPGDYGSIRYSDGRGGLSQPYPLHLEPRGLPFTGRLRVLIDNLTYSAAEDFIQPLVGLQNVSIGGWTLRRRLRTAPRNTAERRLPPQCEYRHHVHARR